MFNLIAPEGVNEKADNSIASMLSGWSDHPKFKDTLTKIVEGTEYRGFTCYRIQHTDKIGVELKTWKEGDSIVNATGYKGKIPQGRIDIPVDWFRHEFLTAMNKRVSFYRYDFKSSGMVPAVSLMNEKSSQFWLLKLVMMARNSMTRKIWNSRIGTLISFPDYGIGCNVNDASVSEVTHHDALIKEEHANKGFFNTLMPDSVFAHNDMNGGIISMENPKKALARITRLVQHPDAVDIGTHKFFVLDSVPSKLADWFVTGSVYTPTHVLGRLGGFRAINSHGLKMTSMMTPVSWEEELDGMWLAAASSFKSGHNGVLEVLSGASFGDLARVDESGIPEYLAKHESFIELDGIKLKGYILDMPVRVTSLYSLYGVRTVDEMTDGIDEVINDDGDIVSSGSFYTSSLNNLIDNEDYDIIGSLRTALDAGSIRYVNQTIDLKMQEMSVAYWSYGREIAEEFMEKVVKKSRKYMRASTREAWDVMSYKPKTPQCFGIDDLITLTSHVYPRQKGLFIVPGILDPDAYVNADEGEAAIDVFLHGIEGTAWDGLRGDKDKMFVIDGEQFYIPGGAVMKEFVHKEEGSGRWFLSGPANVLQKLMVATKGRQVDWKLKTVNHDMDLQHSLLGKSMDSFTVPGFGNKAMLPAPWLRNNELVVLDKAYRGQNGSRVVGSKMPVLFNKAVAGYTMLTGLPKAIFGDIDDRLSLAMKNMVFVNIDVMMDHQNDTDGDMFRVALIDDGLPQYNGLPDHMHTWRDNYVDGEYDLQMKFKPYRAYNSDDINEAVFESAENKNYVGKATNDLTLLSHLLQFLVSVGKFDFYTAVRIRDAYAMGMQDDVVRGIKHAAGDLFKSSSMWNVLYGSFEKMYYSRKAFRMLVHSYMPSNIMFDLEMLFMEFDEFTEATADVVSPLSNRKARSIIDHSYNLVDNEDVIKELDMLTRSYLINSHAAQPTIGKLRSSNAVERASASYCISNLDLYRDKYVLWGQEFQEHSNTMIGSVLTYWRYLDSLDIQTTDK